MKACFAAYLGIDQLVLHADPRVERRFRGSLLSTADAAHEAMRGDLLGEAIDLVSASLGVISGRSSCGRPIKTTTAGPSPRRKVLIERCP